MNAPTIVVPRPSRLIRFLDKYHYYRSLGLSRLTAIRKAWWRVR